MASMMATGVVSDGDIESYQQDGAVCLRNVFGSQWLEKVRAGIETNLANPSQYSENLRKGDGPGYYFNDYCNWTRIPEFKDFVYNSPAAEIAGQLTKSKRMVFYHEHVLTKDAQTFKATPWHTDQSYYPVDGFQNCSIWMPLDRVPQETTIQFVKGSHRFDTWFHPKKFATESNYPVETESMMGKKWTDVPDVDANRDKYEILQWEVNPGDCVVFHMRTLHAAPPNLLGTKRRVLSTRWLGDDCVLAERPWTVSPPILGGLKPGDPVECDIFPVVWRAE